MGNPSIIFLLFIEEAALMVFLGLGLLGYRIPLRKLFVISIIQGILIYLTRSLYILFEAPIGTHSIILIFTMVLLLRYIAGISSGVALAATLLGVSIIGLGDSLLSIPLMERLADSAFVAFRENIFKQVFYGYLSLTFLILLVVVNAITGFKLIDIPRLEKRAK